MREEPIIRGRKEASGINNFTDGKREVEFTV